MHLITGAVKEINGLREGRFLTNADAGFTYEMGHSQRKRKKQDYRKEFVRTGLRSSPTTL
jgi:hypothetical protein